MDFPDFGRLAIVPMLAVSLAGCGGFSLEKLTPWSTAPVERSRSLPADAVTYACEGGKRLVVRYLSGDNAVMIVFPEREFRLDGAPAAQGVHYSNGRTTLESKGEEVRLVEDRAAVYSNCRKSAPEKS